MFFDLTLVPRTFYEYQNKNKKNMNRKQVHIVNG
jgi:hypothetical protein